LLKDEAEFDEVYIVAGHKGQSDKVIAKKREGRRRRLRGSRGRGTLAKEKPPILGMVQRSGEVILKMLPNVQQITIEPVILANVAPGTLIYTD
jgi:transposase-like protein